MHATVDIITITVFTVVISMLATPAQCTAKTLPPPVSGWVRWRHDGATPHSLHNPCAATYKDEIVVVGGHPNPTGLYSLHIDMDHARATWTSNDTRIGRSTRNPSVMKPRSRPTCVVQDGKVYVFGGLVVDAEQQHKLATREMWVMDLRASKPMLNVVRETATSLPPARHRHVSAFFAAKRQLVVHGGADALGHPFSDMWVLSLRQMTWKRFETTSAVAPTARYGHSAVMYNDQMVIIGGHGKDGNVLHDMWVLDIAARVWRHMSEVSVPRSPRGIVAIARLGSTLYLMSGERQVYSLQWSVSAHESTFAQGGTPKRLAMGKFAPPMHESHTVTLYAPPGGDAYLVLVGGRRRSLNLDEDLNDVWAFGLGVRADDAQPHPPSPASDDAIADIAQTAASTEDDEASKIHKEAEKSMPPEKRPPPPRRKPLFALYTTFSKRGN
eukprot:PhM_4_TR1582/c0_g1_i1/m.30331